MKKLVILFLIWYNASAQSTGSLIGVYIANSSVTVRYLDISSTNYSFGGLIPSASSISQAESAYDAVNNIYFVFTSTGIAKINSQTGAYMGVVGNTVALSSFEYNPSGGCLVGTYMSGSNCIYATMNVSTGVVVPIATVTGVSGISQGESAFDIPGNRYFFRSTNKVYVLNANTGAVLTSYSSSLGSLEYNPNNGKLGGLYWSGSSVFFAYMDVGTGAILNQSIIPGVTGIAQGESAFDSAGNRYFCKTNLGISVINALTGSIISTAPGPSNLNSIEYIVGSESCSITISGLPAVVNATTGSNVQLSAVVTASNPSYQWQSNPAGFGWMNVVNNSIYSGAGTASLTVNGVSLQNHLQPFRLIVSSESCSDTSNVSVIHISDTCIVTYVDTVVTVHTGIKNSSGSFNVIRIYPNPASSEFIMDLGDISVMENYAIRITDMLGRDVFSQKVSSKTMHVDVSKLGSKGVYFVQVIDPGNKMVNTQKLIVH